MVIREFKVASGDVVGTGQDEHVVLDITPVDVAGGVADDHRQVGVGVHLLGAARQRDCHVWPISDKGGLGMRMGVGGA